MSEIKVSNDFLIHVYEALDYLPTSNESADLYRRQRSAREAVKALLDSDDVPHAPTPIDYAARYGLHGMSAINVAKLLVHHLSSYSEMGAVLDAWRIANAPQPHTEPDMFWLVDDADEPLSLQHLIDAADNDDGRRLKFIAQKACQNEK